MSVVGWPPVGTLYHRCALRIGENLTAALRTQRKSATGRHAGLYKGKLQKTHSNIFHDLDAPARKCMHDFNFFQGRSLVLCSSKLLPGAHKIDAASSDACSLLRRRVVCSRCAPTALPDLTRPV